MLNVNLYNNEDVVMFTLRGDLSGCGVDELRCYYRVLSVLPTKKSVVLDVSGVTSVDTAGAALLTEMAQKGAEIITGMPPASHPLSEIVRNISPAPKQAVQRSKPERMPLNTILYATDLSPCSEAVLPYVCSLARQHSARVIIAHVIPPTFYYESPDEIRDRAPVAPEEFIRPQLDRVANSAVLKDLKHEVFVGYGEVWPVLSDFVEKRAIDLIAIGTHGRRGLKKLLWGSVAEEIFRLSEHPVLTVGPRALASAANEVSFRNVLIATDFSPESVHALEFATCIIRQPQSTLTLLHVLQTVKAEPSPARRMQVKLFTEFLKDLSSKVEAGVEPEYVVEIGSPSAVIIRVAEERHSDLIVLGLGNNQAHLGPTPPHLFGATAYAVVSGAPCPVLTIRGSLARKKNRAEVIR